MLFSDVAEVSRAYESGKVELHAKITVRIREHNIDEHGEKVSKVTRYETTVGRSLLSEILPPGLSFELINKPLKKKEISKLINAAFRRCGLRETVIFADRLMNAGLRHRHARGPLDRGRRHARPAGQARPDRGGGEGGEGNREPVHLGSRDRRRALQQGGRHLGPRRRPGRQGDDGAVVPRGCGRPRREARQAGVVQLDLHDGRLRRARLRGADPPARGHARPDGEAGRLDHREPDQGELPRGPERAGVLHLHARRARRASPTPRSRRPTRGTSRGVWSTSRRTSS